MSSSSVASSVPASGGSAVPTGTGSANLGDRSADPVASEAESSSAGKSAEGCLAVARSLQANAETAVKVAATAKHCIVIHGVSIFLSGEGHNLDYDVSHEQMWHTAEPPTSPS